MSLEEVTENIRSLLQEDIHARYKLVTVVDPSVLYA